MSRPKADLALTDDERDELLSLIRRRRTAQAIATRANIILMCGGGHDNKVVAGMVGVTEQTVCKWRKRFVEGRIDALYDEPRPGAPRRITDAQVERIVAATLETTPRGETHWSTRSMAKHMGIGK